MGKSPPGGDAVWESPSHSELSATWTSTSAGRGKSCTSWGALPSSLLLLTGGHFPFHPPSHSPPELLVETVASLALHCLPRPLPALHSRQIPLQSSCLPVLMFHDRLPLRHLHYRYGDLGQFLLVPRCVPILTLFFLKWEYNYHQDYY